MKNEILDEALAKIRSAGFKPQVAGGRHWKISWIDRHGRPQRLVVSFSPSDRRARHKSRSVLRRLLRAGNATHSVK
jgi:hypothetical protein